MRIGLQRAGQAARERWWRLLPVTAALLAVTGCSPSDAQNWYGYAYPDLMANLRAQVSGPYTSGPQCLAAMREQEKQARPARPITAGYACARGCRLSSAQGDSGQQLVSDCDEAIR